MELKELKDKLENIFFSYNKVKFLLDNNIKNIIIHNAFHPYIYDHCRLSGGDVLSMIKCEKTNTTLYENIIVVDDINMMLNNAQWTGTFTPEEWINAFFPYNLVKSKKEKKI